MKYPLRLELEVMTTRFCQRQHTAEYLNMYSSVAAQRDRASLILISILVYIRSKHYHGSLLLLYQSRASQ